MEVTPTRHTVRVEAPGYITKEFAITAQEGQITPETYDLEEQPAKIHIEAEGATIFLDGRDMGESTALSMRSGKHFISVAKSGHQSEARPLEVAPGANENLTFDLKTTRQRDAAIGMMIAGGVTAIGGGVILGTSFFRQADAQDIDRKRQAFTISPDEAAEYEEASTERDQFRALGVVVGGVGGLALVIGGGLFLFDSPGPKQPPSDADGEQGTEKKPSDAPSDVEGMTRLAPERGAGPRWSLSPIVAPLGEGWEVGGTWSLRY